MIKHTPGPWEVEYGSSGYPRGIKAPKEDPHKPGGIVSVTRWNAISMPSSPEGQANARLIAAAPDLLMACWSARAYVATHQHDSSAKALQQIEAAIAKATGAA